MNVTEAAQGLGCSSETLRKYERYFELKIERNIENYRNYSNQDMEYFKNILKLKEQGLGLARIKDILEPTVEVQDQKKIIKKSGSDKIRVEELLKVSEKIKSNHQDQKIETIKKSESEKIRLAGLLKVSKNIKSNHMTTDIDHVKQGLELAQINILDRTVEVQDQKIKINKKNELDKIQCSDLEILIAKNISPLRDEMTTEFNNVVQKMNTMRDEMTTGFNNVVQKMNTMIKIQRQEEIIIEEILIEKNQKIEKLEAENQKLRSLGTEDRTALENGSVGGQKVKNRSFLDF
jgi:DNA-binding transcriptional MerR regulator